MGFIENFINRRTLSAKMLSTDPELREAAAFTTGRFNPFHKQHDKLFRSMNFGVPDRERYVFVAVGEEQNEANLFKFETTQEAITACHPNINVIKMPPLTPKNGLEVLGTLRSHCPKGSIYVSGNWPHKLIAHYLGGYCLGERTREGVSATEVRSRMIAGDPRWEQDIPKSAVPIYQRAIKTNDFKIAKDIPVKIRCFGWVKS
jgi:nicotinamide mononucleotide adenylyltransferase